MVGVITRGTGGPAGRMTRVVSDFFGRLSRGLERGSISVGSFNAFGGVVRPTQVTEGPTAKRPMRIPRGRIIGFGPSGGVLGVG